MNELTWEQEQDIQDYNIWLAESQPIRQLTVGDRVRHVNGSKLEGIIKHIYMPLGACEMWAEVLWLDGTRGNVVEPTRHNRIKHGQLRLSALKLV